MCSPLNGNHHFSFVSNPTLSYLSQCNYATFPSAGQDVQFFKKRKQGGEQPVPEWNLDLQGLMGIA